MSPSFGERELLFEAPQVHILRCDKFFEKGNLVWVKLDWKTSLTIANRDYPTLMERSFLCGLEMVKILEFVIKH
jgi:hypothetical protein